MPRSGRTRAPNWASYSDVADAYERYHVQRGYALLARDLVLALELLNGAIVLDVGTGTGAAALIALHRSPRTVIGLDPSLPMLGIAAKKGLKLTVAGEAPGLPFAAERFDAVMASLVLSHFPNYQDALADIVRVLKPGGKLGLTAWAASDSEFARQWRSIAELFVGAEELWKAAQYHPWENWFTDPEHVASALTGARLKEVRLEERKYRVLIAAGEYLSRMESSLIGRWMSHAMDSSRWEEFRRTAAEHFAHRFPSSFTILGRANLAIATK